MSNRKSNSYNLDRRNFLRTGLTVAGALALPTGFATRAFAADHPSIGTYPAGSSGDSVFIGITVPRTGAYALQGEDELKGYLLAIEHINEGNPLIKKISPKTKKGVLGKKVAYGVADSAAKPNDAVQAQQRFISENKAILMTGSTSSAVAVALNKLAQRKRYCMSPASPVPTTPPARIVCATASASASTARPLRPRSVRFWSRHSART